MLCSEVLPGLPREISPFLLGFTGLNWVLLGFYCSFTGFSGYSRILLGFTRFHGVLLGFTGFYWVLLDLTERRCVTEFYRVSVRCGRRSHRSGMSAFDVGNEPDLELALD